jgi:phospholipase/carboxylesterase
MNSRFSFNPSEGYRRLSSQELQFLEGLPVPASEEVPQREIPLSLYLPESYEPRHSYPLVIWLHQNGSNEEQIQQVLPAISDRNYIGLGFRGTSDDGTSSGGAYDWNCSEDSVEDFVYEIRETLTEFQHFFRIDHNRIYLAGFDGGATMALELMLQAPELFSGAVALAGEIPPAKGHGVKFRLLTSRRALLGVGKLDRKISHAQFLDHARDLANTGLQVESQFFNGGHELEPGILREIDRWLMTGCETTYV